jgi:hypothetical protein
MEISQDPAAPVFHVDLIGDMANRMIQYMVALKFASLVPGCCISNVDMSDWGINHPALPAAGPIERERRQQHVALDELSAAMRDGRANRVKYHGFGQRMENFLDADFYRGVFVCPFQEDLGFGSDVLLCPVRGGDIIDGPARDYPLTPPKFYADIIAQTGLRPVFMGQTEPNHYTDRLRLHFPNALFLKSRGAMRDFETIRQSKNIVVGVSTFIWLAAWLSHAETIHLAVNGLLNPLQVPVVDLLPFGDPRYRYHLFPLNYGVSREDQEAAHAAIAPFWRLVPADLLQRQIAEAPRVPVDWPSMLAAYDEAYYLATNADVAIGVSEGWLPNGQAHYVGAAFREGRFGFPLDRKWYAMQYPLAALEVAAGDYLDFTHHYVAVGRARGYRPLPE